ncbi:MAG: biotin/lipoyl-binding protein [Clostridia bacterium]|nr:biotin/lipoyl-binding protein [Clostridia bacterium]
MLRKFKITVNNEIYEVEVEEITEAGATPAPAPQPVQTAKPAAEAKPAPQPASQPAPQPAKTPAGGGQQVVAPLPGSVLNILVNVGDKVTAGQTVLILEAMKMENEIAAPVSGTVTSLLVSKGQTVNTNEVLMTIE